MTACSSLRDARLLKHEFNGLPDTCIMIDTGRISLCLADCMIAIHNADTVLVGVVTYDQVCSPLPVLAQRAPAAAR